MQLKKRSKSLNNRIQKQKSFTEHNNYQDSVKSLKPHMEESEAFRVIESITTLQQKCNYKLSIQHLLFLMEEQKSKEINVLKKDSQLLSYYNCFIYLFTLLYQASKLVISHMFSDKEKSLDISRLQVILMLIEDKIQYSIKPKMIRLQVLARNITKLTDKQQDFQYRIEFIARKVTLYKAKQEQIKSISLAQNLKQQWARLTKEYSQEQNYYLENMFQSPSEKLCFLDVHTFINSKFLTPNYFESIYYGGRRIINQHLNYDFKFEFKFIQDLCIFPSTSQKTKLKINNEPCSII